MSVDVRAQAAKYYDADPNAPDDVEFYRARVPFPDASVLELGCGTGRVLVSLVESCGHILGIDSSAAMLAVCADKLRHAGFDRSLADLRAEDVTQFSLERRFDLITAPYRVVQALESDRELSGFFRCIRAHLAPGGSCILNAFRPLHDLDGMRSRWITPGETFNWDVSYDGGRLVRHDRRGRMDLERQVLYPELVYRRYAAGKMLDEVVLGIVMRFWYPGGFLKLVESHGFQVMGRWGGYGGEPYGEGPELVVQFR